MKKVLYILAAVFTLGTSVASAQKVGHVNSQELLLGLPERAAAEAELKKYADEKKAEIDALTARYQQEVQKYLAEKDKLTPAIQQSRESDIMEMEKRIQEVQQNAEDNLQKKEQLLMEPMIKRVKDAIGKVAKANGVNYVFDVNTLIYYEGGTDLQEQVKKELGTTAVTPNTNTPNNTPKTGTGGK